MYRGIIDGTVPGDRDKVRGLLLAGLARMSLFHRGGGTFSLWEGGSADLRTTHKVVRNLRPLAGLPFPDGEELVQAGAAVLRQEKVRDNALLPLDPAFAADVNTVEDAAAMALFGPEFAREPARAFLRGRAKVSNGLATWPAATSWGGEMEATCEALRALRVSDPDLFARGFRAVGAGLMEGRLYSTADTRALLELLGDMALPPTRRARLDGAETALHRPELVARAEAVEGPLLVRVDSERVIDVLAPRSDFRSSLGAGRREAGLRDRISRWLGGTQPVALGERITIELKPEEATRAPICRVFLPPGFAFLTAGANAQTTHQPVVGAALRIDAVAVRPGRGKLRAMIYDMYDSGKVGVLPEIELSSG